MVNMLGKFSLIFVCIFMSHTVTKATFVPVSRCQGKGEGYCAIKKIDVTPSEKVVEDDSCIIDRGSNISVSFEYTPNFTSTNVKWSISRVTIFGDFRLKQLDEDACHFTHCPIEANTRNKFEVSLSIPADLSTKKYAAKVKLIGNDTKDNCCFLINIRVRKPVSKSASPQQTSIPLDFYGSPMTYPNGSALKNFNITPPTWSEFLNKSLMLAKERAEKTTTAKVSFWKRPFYSLWNGNEEETKNVTVDSAIAAGNETVASNETSVVNETDYGNEYAGSHNETFANVETNSYNETAPEYEAAKDEAIAENGTETSQPDADADKEAVKGDENVEENVNYVTTEEITPTSVESEIPTEETEMETTPKPEPSTEAVTAPVSTETPTKVKAEKITMKAMLIKEPKTEAKSKNILTLKIWLPHLEKSKIQGFF